MYLATAGLTIKAGLPVPAGPAAHARLHAQYPKP